MIPCPKAQYATLSGVSISYRRGENMLLFYTIAIVFQLHHADDMMYEMMMRNPEPMPFPDSRDIQTPTPDRYGMRGTDF